MTWLLSTLAAIGTFLVIFCMIWLIHTERFWIVISIMILIFATVLWHCCLFE
jgi:hypothetical protein